MDKIDLIGRICPKNKKTLRRAETSYMKLKKLEHYINVLVYVYISDLSISVYCAYFFGL
mgnify:CR=1 FL=1